MILFNETNHIFMKLIGIILLSIGIFFMIEKKKSTTIKENKQWILYAILSAVFVALTSILVKIEIENVDSNLATTIRTCIVLITAWMIAFAKRKQNQFKKQIKKSFSLSVFLVLLLVCMALLLCCSKRYCRCSRAN